MVSAWWDSPSVASGNSAYEKSGVRFLSEGMNLLPGPGGKDGFDNTTTRANVAACDVHVRLHLMGFAAIS